MLFNNYCNFVSDNGCYLAKKGKAGKTMTKHYFDHQENKFYDIRKLDSSFLEKCVKNRYAKCVKEWRINLVLYTLSGEMIGELKKRNDCSQELITYMEEKAKEEVKELTRQMKEMGCEEGEIKALISESYNPSTSSDRSTCSCP